MINNFETYLLTHASTFLSDLDFREGLLGVEGDPDWEEVVSVAPAGELHGAGGVAAVDDRQLPQEGAPLLVGVVAVTLRNHGSVHAVTTKEKKRHLNNRENFYGRTSIKFL